MSGSGKLTLNNSELINGDADLEDGGAILNDGGLLIVDRSVIRNNTARRGAGIATQNSGTTNITSTEVYENVAGAIDLTFGIALDGLGGGLSVIGTSSLVVDKSDVKNNSADFFGQGGGIYNQESEVEIVNSYVGENTSHSGGGIYVSSFFSNPLMTITDSEILLNNAQLGGGIDVHAGAVLSVVSSEIRMNSAESGAGLRSSGVITIDGSTISDNGSDTANGLFSETGGGMDISGASSNATIMNSTIARNDAENLGGGLFIHNAATVELVNSTISGNVARPRALGVGLGGGLYMSSGSNLSLSFSTVTGNVAGSFGGGLNFLNSTATLAGNLVSGNLSDGEPMGQELFAPAMATSTTSTAPNLFGHSGFTTAEAIAGFTPSASDVTATVDGNTPTQLMDIVNTTLINNGGPIQTRTHALKPGSPAIDAAGSPAVGLPAFPLTDQRGVDRPDGSAHDIGSFEGDVALCDMLEVTVDIGNGDTPSAGNDVILGTNDGDIINSLAGDDTICALDGNDVIDAGGGDDYVDSGDGDDDIHGGGGNDLLIGGLGDDVIRGGSGDDFMDGERGDDSLIGQPGNDTIWGGHGIDDINGGGGRDTIHTGTGATVGSGVFASGGSGSDTIHGGPDADDIRGSNGADTIFGEGGDDVITGGNGRDTINGGNGNDNIKGQESRDTLNGDAGNDTISGGAQDDTLNGGTGIDSCNGQAGIDTADASCEITTGVP